ncbi:MAG: Gx transporter family protein [Lachnospiraceae bacterium]|nr:Gx transporter family protein [Lachnospiraceae bacterium]
MSENRKSSSQSVKRLSVYGLLIALAFVLSYVETLIPMAALGIVIPGIKIGLANVVVMVALYTMGARDALVLSLIRILLVGFTFGNTVSMIYSLGGGLLSYLVMVLLKKAKVFQMITVSIAGGIFHNVGQILMAMLVLENAGVAAYLPVLFLSGTVTGLLIGLLGGEVAKRIRRAIAGA